jgi:glycosyltransferase involved in cell wall biosynthesis
MSACVPTIAVVIPTYKRCHSLCRVLEPLLTDKATSEIIVVVDGANDGSFELLEGMRTRDSRVKPVLVEHCGQAAAQRHGSLLASSDVILFLDDDVIPDQGLVSGHARHHQRADNLIVVGYMPVINRSKNWIVRRYASRYDRMIERWIRNPEIILRTLWGGNLSLFRAHLERVPIARDDYQFGYHMDLEFGLRCEKADLRAVFDPMLRSRHEYSRSAEQFLRDRAASAVDRALIHRLHQDLIGPIPENYFTDDAGLFVSLMLRLLRSKSVPAEYLLKLVAIFSTRSTRYSRLQEIICDCLERLRGQRIADEIDRVFDQSSTEGVAAQRIIAIRNSRH